MCSGAVCRASSVFLSMSTFCMNEITKTTTTKTEGQSVKEHCLTHQHCWTFQLLLYEDLEILMLQFKTNCYGAIKSHRFQNLWQWCARMFSSVSKFTPGPPTARCKYSKKKRERDKREATEMSQLWEQPVRLTVCVCANCVFLLKGLLHM